MDSKDLDIARKKVVLALFKELQKNELSDEH